MRNAGRPVAREELLRVIWPDTHVVPNSVTQAIAALRRSLQGTRAGLCIKPVPHVGYLLDATVATGESLRFDEAWAERSLGRVAPVFVAAGLTHSTRHDTLRA